jgi:DNA (cytosine-5)-methyltransferase 1
MITVGSCFSGVGGIELGLERTGGFKTIWQIENDPYATAVLAKHWPDVPRFGDIRTVDYSRLERPDLICGGYPCQPFSLAGERSGETDARHLWPYLLSAIRILRPGLCFLENVPGHLSLGFGRVLGDLAECGYDAEWGVLSAAGVGAPHLRRRVFILAHAMRDGRGERITQSQVWKWRSDIIGSGASLANAARSEVRSGPRKNGARKQEGSKRSRNGRPYVANTAGAGFQNGRGLAPEQSAEEFERLGWWGAEPDVGRVAHGVPSRVDRLRCLGNAVVPQVAQAVGEKILRWLDADHR